MFTLTLTLSNTEPFEVGLDQAYVPLAIAEARRLKNAILQGGIKPFSIKVVATNESNAEPFFDYQCVTRPRPAVLSVPVGLVA